MENVVTSSGAFLGLALGGLWLLKQEHGDKYAISVDYRNRTGGKIILASKRYFVGVIGVVALWAGLGAIFPRSPYLLAYILRFVRYALIGVWISALAPFLFHHLRLSFPKETKTGTA